MRIVKRGKLPLQKLLMNKNKHYIAEQKFRPLKHQLQKVFKDMRFSLQDNTPPAAALVAEFIQQVEIMVSYPGFGDENYPDFLEACRQLGCLTPETPLPVWQRYLEVIAALRRHCHQILRS